MPIRRFGGPKPVIPKDLSVSMFSPKNIVGPFNRPTAGAGGPLLRAVGQRGASTSQDPIAPTPMGAPPPEHVSGIGGIAVPGGGRRLKRPGGR